MDKLFVAACVAACTAMAPLQAATATFDGVTASPFFDATMPGGPAGPVVTEAGITFSGGVILNGRGFSNLETTTPNLYATMDSSPLADGSSLPGTIKATLASLATALSLDLINGSSAAAFTVTLFNGATNVGSQATSLASYPAWDPSRACRCPAPRSIALP